MCSYSKRQSRLLKELRDNMSLNGYSREKQKELDKSYQDIKKWHIEVLKEELKGLLYQTEGEKRAEFLTYAISSICQKHPTATLALERSLELLKKKNVDLESKIWVEGIKRIRELISINPNDYRLPPNF